MTTNTIGKGHRCRWMQCEAVRTPGSYFCVVHVQPPPKEDLSQWVRQLPLAVGPVLATCLLYDMLKCYAKIVHFHDTVSSKVDGMLARLHMREALASVSTEEVAQFLEPLAADPRFSSDMGKALRSCRRNTEVEG